MTGGATLRLPLSPHLPGRTARPDEAVFAPFKAGLVPGLSIQALADSPALQAGFAAYEAGYFWEAHELWEPVWALLPPASSERHLMAGLIQLANARLKLRMGRVAAARRVAARAEAALAEACLGGPKMLLGLSPTEVAALENRLRDLLADDGSAS